MPKTLAIPAVSILLTAILALILLHRPESVVGVSATPPMPENTTTTQLSEEHLWIEIPRKAHEPQLQIEIQPDKLILPEQDNQALSEQALDRQKKKLSYRFATRMELGKKASQIGSWTDLTPRSTSPTLEAIDEQAHDRAFYRLHVEVP